MIFFNKKKINATTLNKLRENWTTEKPCWLALEMNQNNSHDQEESYALELHYKGSSLKVNRLEWRYDINTHQLNTRALIANKNIFDGSISKDDELFQENFLPTLEGTIHHFFIQMRELLVECGKRAPQGSFNPTENQGKEWLRVSLEVLKNALSSVNDNRQQDGQEVLQGLIFCGHHPNTGKFIFRLRIFNLDLEMTEDETNSLRFMVFDKKNKESFQGLEPVLKAVIGQEKAPVIDILIKILPYISAGLMLPTRK